MRNVGDKCIKFQVYELTAPALQVYIRRLSLTQIQNLKHQTTA